MSFHIKSKQSDVNSLKIMFLEANKYPAYPKSTRHHTECSLIDSAYLIYKSFYNTEPGFGYNSNGGAGMYLFEPFQSP